jgi:4-hydroxyphenylpyruvate dioxygenase
MSRVEPLGITGIHSLHYYVRDLDRIRRLFVDQLDFAEIGGSDPALTARGRQRSVAFRAGEATFVFSTPLAEDARASRFLRKHPEGVGAIVFSVADIERAFHLLERREGTMIDEIATVDTPGGRFSTFSITTPFGDATFRFVQAEPGAPLYPGFLAHEAPRGGSNRFGFGQIDHITSNFPTMAPALLWMEHVMGFRRYWDVEFHTDDVAAGRGHGSGLKSVVMVDPDSGVKFANNEPKRPFFRASQINVFAEDHRGAGIQHAALTVADIVPAVRALRERGVAFMPTPGAYYDALPERLVTSGIGAVDEPLDVLRELEILVDGAEEHRYLLQIFLREAAGLFGDPQAGPFFIEIIQRKGDKGFGAGNFRALFESIERQQRAEGKIA